MDVRGRVEAEPVGDVTATLGEGPYWVPEDGCLLWVDIHGGQLHRTDVSSGATESVSVESVSAAFPVNGGGILIAAGSRLSLRSSWGTDEPKPRVVAEVWARPDVRFNDGAVDPAGRVWIGSMHTGETDPLGDLCRLDNGGVLTPLVRKVTISNGIGWSPDGARMYYVDSPSRKIDVFDYNSASGELYGRRVFSDLQYADGVPDGLTVDADGCVWVAMYGGAAIRRFTPAGKPDVALPVPVARPTSCAFGGPNLSELYVTTASAGLSEAARKAQPLAGRLLRLRPGPFGLPSATAQVTLPHLPEPEPEPEPDAGAEESAAESADAQE